MPEVPFRVDPSLKGLPEWMRFLCNKMLASDLVKYYEYESKAMMGRIPDMDIQVKFSVVYSKPQKYEYSPKPLIGTLDETSESSDLSSTSLPALEDSISPENAPEPEAPKTLVPELTDEENTRQWNTQKRENEIKAYNTNRQYLRNKLGKPREAAEYLKPHDASIYGKLDRARDRRGYPSFPPSPDYATIATKFDEDFPDVGITARRKGIRWHLAFARKKFYHDQGLISPEPGQIIPVKTPPKTEEQEVAEIYAEAKMRMLKQMAEIEAAEKLKRIERIEEAERQLAIEQRLKFQNFQLQQRREWMAINDSRGLAPETRERESRTHDQPDGEENDIVGPLPPTKALGKKSVNRPNVSGGTPGQRRLDDARRFSDTDGGKKGERGEEGGTKTVTRSDSMEGGSTPTTTTTRRARNSKQDTPVANSNRRRSSGRRRSFGGSVTTLEDLENRQQAQPLRLQQQQTQQEQIQQERIQEAQIQQEEIQQTLLQEELTPEEEDHLRIRQQRLQQHEQRLRLQQELQQEQLQREQQQQQQLEVGGNQAAVGSGQKRSFSDYRPTQALDEQSRIRAIQEEELNANQEVRRQEILEIQADLKKYSAKGMLEAQREKEKEEYDRMKDVKIMYSVQQTSEIKRREAEKRMNLEEEKREKKFREEQRNMQWMERIDEFDRQREEKRMARSNKKRDEWTEYVQMIRESDADEEEIERMRKVAFNQILEWSPGLECELDDSLVYFISADPSDMPIRRELQLNAEHEKREKEKEEQRLMEELERDRRKSEEGRRKRIEEEEERRKNDEEKMTKLFAPDPNDSFGPVSPRVFEPWSAKTPPLPKDFFKNVIRQFMRDERDSDDSSDSYDSDAPDKDAELFKNMRPGEIEDFKLDRWIEKKKRQEERRKARAILARKPTTSQPFMKNDGHGISDIESDASSDEDGSGLPSYNKRRATKDPINRQLRYETSSPKGYHEDDSSESESSDGWSPTNKIPNMGTAKGFYGGFGGKKDSDGWSPAKKIPDKGTAEGFYAAFGGEKDSDGWSPTNKTPDKGTAEGFFGGFGGEKGSDSWSPKNKTLDMPEGYDSLAANLNRGTYSGSRAIANNNRGTYSGGAANRNKGTYFGAGVAANKNRGTYSGGPANKNRGTYSGGGQIPNEAFASGSAFSNEDPFANETSARFSNEGVDFNPFDNLNQTIGIAASSMPSFEEEDDRTEEEKEMDRERSRPSKTPEKYISDPRNDYLNTSAIFLKETTKARGKFPYKMTKYTGELTATLKACNLHSCVAYLPAMLTGSKHQKEASPVLDKSTLSWATTPRKTPEQSEGEWDPSPVIQKLPFQDDASVLYDEDFGDLDHESLFIHSLYRPPTTSDSSSTSISIPTTPAATAVNLPNLTRSISPRGSPHITANLPNVNPNAAFNAEVEINPPNRTPPNATRPNVNPNVTFNAAPISTTTRNARQAIADARTRFLAKNTKNAPQKRKSSEAAKSWSQQKQKRKK